MKQCYLAFQIGSMRKTIYPLLGTTTIGRGADNTITVPDPTVSRNHAKVSLQHGVWTVEDMQSVNGIFVDGTYVKKLVLKGGGSFKLGNIVFSFTESEITHTTDQLSETLEILTASPENLDLLDEKEEAERWMKRIQDVLGAVPFFSFLDEVERKKLADVASLHGFNAGEMIIREGDPGRSVYVVLSGRVKVFSRDYKGNEFELAILEKSQFFGEMSFLTGKPRPAYMVACETTTLMELSYTSMKELVQENPAVKKVLLEYYSDRVQNLEEKHSEIEAGERRHDPRVKKRISVKLFIPPQNAPQDEADSKFWQASSLDVSITGILVRISEGEPEDLQPGSRVLLELSLPAPREKIRTEGIVRRTRVSEKQKSIMLLGIQFVGMSHNDSNKLYEFIYGESLI